MICDVYRIPFLMFIMIWFTWSNVSSMCNGYALHILIKNYIEYNRSYLELLALDYELFSDI